MCSPRRVTAFAPSMYTGAAGVSLAPPEARGTEPPPARARLAVASRVVGRSEAGAVSSGGGVASSARASSRR